MDRRHTDIWLKRNLICVQFAEDNIYLCVCSERFSQFNVQSIDHYAKHKRGLIHFCSFYSLHEHYIDFQEPLLLCLDKHCYFIADNLQELCTHFPHHERIRPVFGLNRIVHSSVYVVFPCFPHLDSSFAPRKPTKELFNFYPHFERSL